MKSLTIDHPSQKGAEIGPRASDSEIGLVGVDKLNNEWIIGAMFA